MRSYRRPERVSALSAGRGGQVDELTNGSGYTIFSYLIAGMLAYGGIGWLVGHYTHLSLLFPIGMLVGLAISVGWIIYRYGRPHKLGNPPEGR
jgi:F0F1-type ATP synthase assembly protein I